MTDPSEMHEPAAGYASPPEAASPPPAPPCPEPWSHPWHDQLGLLYHRAIADKIRRQPALLEVARDNLRRWMAAAGGETPSRAWLEWQRILESGDADHIIGIMTDPSEEGHRRRQSTPFAGILTAEERLAIRDPLLEGDGNNPACTMPNAVR